MIRDKEKMNKPTIISEQKEHKEEDNEREKKA